VANKKSRAERLASATPGYFVCRFNTIAMLAVFYFRNLRVNEMPKALKWHTENIKTKKP